MVGWWQGAKAGGNRGYRVQIMRGSNCGSDSNPGFAVRVGAVASATATADPCLKSKIEGLLSHVRKKKKNLSWI